MPGMSEIVPVNRLEIELRKVLQDRNAPLWGFYTPLAAEKVWLIVGHDPSKDGTDEAIAAPGQNPAVCVWKGEEDSWIGIYTAECRAREVMERRGISPQKMTCIYAQGYEVLRWLSTMEEKLCMNLGLKEWQKVLDADMVDILLRREQPPVKEEGAVDHVVKVFPAVDPTPHLERVKEFLSGQPNVRAAWVFGRAPEPGMPEGTPCYEICLVMRDPEDRSLVDTVTTMAKALSPVEMEWTTAVIMADEQSLRNLARQRAPFYSAPA